MLIDTEKDTGGAPVQTSFHFPSRFRRFKRPYLLLEPGVHEPSPAECLAPFHQDRTQRIVVLSTPHPAGPLVFPVEALLKLADGREGSEIGWDEWKIHALIPSIPKRDLDDFCVSGCRLFTITTGRGPNVGVGVYDFSMQGRAKYLSDQINADLGGVGYLASTGTIAQLSQGINDISYMFGGHGSVLFFRVSFLLFSCTTD